MNIELVRNAVVAYAIAEKDLRAARAAINPETYQVPVERFGEIKPQWQCRHSMRNLLFGMIKQQPVRAELQKLVIELAKLDREPDLARLDVTVARILAGGPAFLPRKAAQAVHEAVETSTPAPKAARNRVRACACCRKRRTIVEETGMCRHCSEQATKAAHDEAA